MDEIKNKIKELEDEMQKTDFWGNKIRAQEVIKELGELKEKLTGGEKIRQRRRRFDAFCRSGRRRRRRLGENPF